MSAPGDLITADWQVELQGLLMGEQTAYELVEWNPWTAPNARVDEMARSGSDGVVAGVDLVGGRAISARFMLASDDVADDLANMRALAAAWSMAPHDVPIVWQEATGRRYRLIGRPRLAAPDLTPGLPVECRFLAVDPVVYDDAEQSSGMVPFPAGGSGATPPLTPPVVFGSGGSSGTFSATNGGTADVGWVVEFVGPWVNPVVENVGVGQRVELVGSVPSGSTLTIDSRASSVILDGSARLAWLRASSQWWTLPPGDTEVRLTGASGSGSAEFTWRSGWK